MSTLVVVVTHLDAASVDARARELQAVAGDVRIALCHGGPRAVFDEVAHPDKAWIDDPTLRGAPRSYQSYHVIFETVWRHWVQPDATIDAVLVLEYDHLVLRPGFTATLAGVAQRTGAGLLGKDAFRRTGTNWEHYGRFRSDPALLGHLRRLSVREEPDVMYGVLGDGMWLSRPALGDYVAVGDHPRCYGELYVATLLHHLGHRVVDVDAHCDLYAHVRWHPDCTRDEVLALAAGGATFVHPVKDPRAWQAAVAAVAAPAGEAAAGERPHGGR